MDTTVTPVVLHPVFTTHWSDGPTLVEEITDRLPDVDVEYATTPVESEALISDAEVVVTSHMPEELLEAASSLRWIQAVSSGVDFFDFDVLQDRGIVLTNAAGIHAQPIAEQVLGYMLCFERDMHRGIRQQSRGVWERYEGGELAGKTLGIVGIGAIGARVAELAATFGMRVIGTKRNPETVSSAVDEAFTPDRLHDVLEGSDYILVACPLNDDTQHLFGNTEFGVMRDSAILINIARGPVVDEDALIVALQQRMIGGAALDVFEHEPLAPDSPLWDLSNVIITPHMAGSSPRKEARLAEIFSTNYDAFVTDDVDSMVNRVL